MGGVHRHGVQHYAAAFFTSRSGFTNSGESIEARVTNRDTLYTRSSRESNGFRTFHSSRTPAPSESHSRSSSGRKMAGIRLCIGASAEFGAVVMMANVFTSGIPSTSLRSQMPANAKGEPLFITMR